MIDSYYAAWNFVFEETQSCAERCAMQIEFAILKKSQQLSRLFRVAAHPLIWCCYFTYLYLYSGHLEQLGSDISNESWVAPSPGLKAVRAIAMSRFAHKKTQTNIVVCYFRTLHLFCICEGYPSSDYFRLCKTNLTSRTWKPSPVRPKEFIRYSLFTNQTRNLI